MPSGAYVQIWDVVTGKTIGMPLIQIEIDHSSEFVFSFDGKYLAAGSDKKVYLWDVANSKALNTILSDQRGITSLAFSIKEISWLQQTALKELYAYGVYKTVRQLKNLWRLGLQVTNRKWSFTTNLT